jgi:hypothetical protein
VRLAGVNLRHRYVDTDQNARAELLLEVTALDARDSDRLAAIGLNRC